jgi:hypothetical protein
VFLVYLVGLGSLNKTNPQAISACDSKDSGSLLPVALCMQIWHPVEAVQTKRI